jgi:hypothetical protein
MLNDSTTFSSNSPEIAETIAANDRQTGEDANVEKTGVVKDELTRDDLPGRKTRYTATQENDYKICFP